MGAQCPERLENMRRSLHSYKNWKANACGVDIERNYPFLWEEKHSGVNTPAAEGYKGSKAVSERETKAVVHFCKRENFDFAAVFKAKGEKIHISDKQSICSDRTRRVAEKISLINGYDVKYVLTDPSENCACFENWFRSEFQKDCMVFYMGKHKNGYLPLDMGYFYDEIWEPGKLIIIVCANDL